ncbi:MAG: alpha/beta hydrolase [Spirochaetales bacterium]|nr:alpha/beta hydrolase [Spirochaetales bacterium]
MANMNSYWGIRNLLAPVLTRLLIYETNPIDLERVISTIENVELTHINVLEENWVAQWEDKAKQYLVIVEEAEKEGNYETVKKLYHYVAQCYYAIFLINFAHIEDKKNNYAKYVRFYQKAASYYNPPVKRIQIPFENSTSLFAHLHVPEGKGPFPCTMIISGAGSCKEEMNILARPLVKRGIAAFVIDLPGVGESLYVSDLKCRWRLIKKAFDTFLNYIQNHKQISSNKIGCIGLCMGGGLAYRLVSQSDQITYLATLFPLFINYSEKNTPRWMTQGSYYKNLTGGEVAVAEYIKEMSLGEKDAVNCPYFFVHGRNDNWMTLDEAQTLYDRAKGEKKRLIIEEEAVYYNSTKVVHAMPVGEQMHWVKHVIADWIKRYSCEKDMTG